VLKEGQVCDNIYFIEQGYLRSFYLKDGKEITAWFMKENDVIVSVNSFFKREPSYEYIQAIEDSILHYVQCTSV
jgi:CRP-like cAMP-binding protein